MDNPLKVEVMTLDHVNSLLTRELFRHSPLNQESTRDQLIIEGHSISILDNKGTCGCIGIIPIWDGVGEAWALITEDLRSRPLLMMRIMKELFASVAATGKFHRIQITVLAENSGYCKWAETLGFTFEGVMLKYGPDKKNHFRYAKIY